MINQYDSGIAPTWCPGCGNFGILTALKQAFTNLNLKPQDVSLFYDIGCSSNLASFIKTYGFNGLHGRSLSAGIGASLASHKTPIISIAGDGGAYGEGLNHLLSACRANYNLLFLVFNNQLYSLTTGQTSATTRKAEKTKSTPFGSIAEPFNPLASAIVNHCSWVARGFSLEPEHLTELIIKGFRNNGFSLIDILTPCVTWNKDSQPILWYKERIYKLKHDGYPMDRALKLCFSEPKKLPLGVFYQEKRPSYQDALPQLQEKPLAEQSIDKIDISKLIEEFT